MEFREVEVHCGVGVRGVRSGGGEGSGKPDDHAVNRRINYFFENDQRTGGKEKVLSK